MEGLVAGVCTKLLLLSQGGMFLPGLPRSSRKEEEYKKLLSSHRGLVLFQKIPPDSPWEESRKGASGHFEGPAPYSQGQSWQALKVRAPLMPAPHGLGFQAIFLLRVNTEDQTCYPHPLTSAPPLWKPKSLLMTPE